MPARPGFSELLVPQWGIDVPRFLCPPIPPARNLVKIRYVPQTGVRHAACESRGKHGCS